MRKKTKILLTCQSCGRSFFMQKGTYDKKSASGERVFFCNKTCAIDAHTPNAVKIEVSGFTPDKMQQELNEWRYRSQFFKNPRPIHPMIIRIEEKLKQQNNE